ncbi:MAG: hypothetical protein FVQ83_17025 [Chloroflexi bacterium]|nr:hypothetical protein [Chloroflexota bacterium]
MSLFRMIVFLLVILIVAACASVEQTVDNIAVQQSPTPPLLDSPTELSEVDQFGDDLTVYVPLGTPAAIDGILSPGEWDDA